MEELFEGLADLSEEAKKTLSERIESEKAKWIEGAKNDPEFIKSLKNSEAGKFYGSMERIFGRNFADLEMEKYNDLQGIKKMEAILKDGVSAMAENKDKTSQEWQQKYIDAQAEVKRVKEEEVPTLLTQERERFYQRFIGDEILKDSLDYEVICSTDARLPLVQAYLNKNGYQTKWDNEASKYEIVTNDGVKVTKDDKVLAPKDIIRDAFEESGVLVKNNGTPEEPRKPGQTVVKSSGKLSANAQRMLDNVRVD